MLNESEIESLQVLIAKYGYDAVAEEVRGMGAVIDEDNRPWLDEVGNCAHEWAYSGTAYGGDDERWFGDGRCYCAKCGADGDS